jgi:hypothetical protein
MPLPRKILIVGGGVFGCELKKYAGYISQCMSSIYIYLTTPVSRIDPLPIDSPTNTPQCPLPSHCRSDTLNQK